MEHREVLATQTDREAAESEDVEVVALAPVVGRIALDAAAVCCTGYGAQDVDHVGGP